MHAAGAMAEKRSLKAVRRGGRCKSDGDRRAESAFGLKWTDLVVTVIYK
jgi:hypothetical protein